MDITENTAKTVAGAVQILGAAVACLTLVMWAWTVATGSLLGFVLLLLLGLLFVAPIIAWGLPAIALVIGLIAQGVIVMIRRSRA